MNHETPKDGGQHTGGGKQGEHLEGSLTDGGSLPGTKTADEDRSFGAGRRDDDDEPAQAEPAEGTSGSTGASTAGSGDGDKHLGTAGFGGAAGGDQLTEVPQGPGQPR
jgi:hypothetical protein